MKRILFVCTGNTCRSPMAEGLFRSLLYQKDLQEKYDCESAGLNALDGVPVSENAAEALRELDVDISDHTSRQLTPDMLSRFDVFAVMTNRHKQLLENAGVDSDKIVILGGGIDDPYGGDLEIYRLCRDQIDEALPCLL